MDGCVQVHGMLQLLFHGMCCQTGMGFGGWYIIISHVDASNCISHCFSHYMMLPMLACSFWQSYSDMISIICKIQLFANNLTDLWCACSVRSVMKTRTEMGPNTVPWGTPDVTEVDSDISLSMTTHWVMFQRIPAVHLSGFSLSP